MDMNNTTPIAAGLGLITFFEDGKATALIRPISADAWHTGTYDEAGITINNDAVMLGLRRPRRETDNGPKLEGTLVNKLTGESVKIIAWRAQLEDGTPCLGLSPERPMPRRVASPF